MEPRGTSNTPREQRLSPGDQARSRTPGTGENICRQCQGSGKVNDRECQNCGGSGRITEGIGGV